MISPLVVLLSRGSISYSSSIIFQTAPANRPSKNDPRSQRKKVARNTLKEFIQTLSKRLDAHAPNEPKMAMEVSKSFKLTSIASSARSANFEGF
jgi:hypothetical protein